MSSSKEIKELESKIVEAKNAYYGGGKAIVSDKVYDAWVDTLAALDPKNKLLFEVGAEPVSNWEKHTHSTPMLSLGKAQTNEEYSAWHKKYIQKDDLAFVTLKLDGLSVSLEYEDGKLVRATTRGSGIAGEIITPNVCQMQYVPLRLKKRVNATVRGEILLSKENHEKFFADYSNPRNAASGICRRYDGTGCDKLSILCYELHCDELKFQTYHEMFLTLQELGFAHPPFYLLKSLQEVVNLKDEFQKTLRDKFVMLLDGLVIHNDNLAKWFAWGYNDHHPYGSIAFKFEAPAKETTIKEIICQVGNSGRITPVAVFFPKVELAGAEVEKASLHNFANINDLEVDIGSKVIVSRRNDVIPYVEEVSQSTGTVFSPPSVCPVCKSRTRMLGEYLVCTNPLTCPAQITGRIKNWINGNNILEWGETIVSRLVESGKVKTIADLYRLSEGDISSMERMGEKSAKKLIQLMTASKEITLEKLIGNLSIPMVGETVVGLAADAGYNTVKKLLGASVEDLSSISGLGPIKANSLYAGLKANEGLITELLSVGIVVKEKTGVLVGKSFCFTGTMKNKRPVLEKMVVDNGGTTKSSVGKGLDFLVIADPNSTSGKAVAARKNGTQCVSEEDFLKMVGS